MLAGPPTTVLGGWRARRRQLRIIVLSAPLFFARVVVLRSAPHGTGARGRNHIKLIVLGSRVQYVRICGADRVLVCDCVS